MYTIHHVAQPMPGVHVIRQPFFDGISLLDPGAAVAFLYRRQELQ